jgi:hypothetical protein
VRTWAHKVQVRFFSGGRDFCHESAQDGGAFLGGGGGQCGQARPHVGLGRLQLPVAHFGGGHGGFLGGDVAKQAVHLVL